MRGRGITASGDVDFVASGEKKFWIHTCRIFHIPHANGAAHRVTVGTGGRVTDHLIVAIDRFAAPKDRLGVSKNEGYELAFETALLLLEQGIASEKWDGFFPG